MAAHSARILTNALIVALENAGLVVGDGDKSEGAENAGWQGAAGTSQFLAYTVVFPSPGGFSDGTLCNPFDDVQPDYIISSFGATREQAQWGDDKVRDALASTGTIIVAGRRVLLAIPDVEGGVIRDDDVTPPIFHAPTRWRLRTTAAA